MVIAGAVAKWYFTANKATDLPTMPCCRATGRTVRFHLGSIAFGALIIAIVQMVRLILEYIDRKTKAAQVCAWLCCVRARSCGSRAHACSCVQAKNRMIEILIKCLKCCLWCFEKCLQFIS
jgi:choline transporter-like protein 2/4/5